MRVLVTRPEPDGERTAAQLRARGCEVMLAPLLHMEAIETDLDGGPWSAIALTSVNAARAVAGQRGLAALRSVPVIAVGARTADAARGLGFAYVVSADGDVQDLIRVIRDRHVRGARLLYLAGEDRAADLAGALAADGIDVRTAVVYRAVAATELPADVRGALTAGRIDGVLHFSRRSAAVYVDCSQTAGILDKALRPFQYCVSQRTAEPLMAAGATAIRIAERPAEDHMIGLVTV